MQDEPVSYTVGREDPHIPFDDFEDAPQEDWHPTLTRPIYYTNKKPPSGNEDLLYAQGLLAAGAAILEKKRQDYAGEGTVFDVFESVGQMADEAIAAGVPGVHLVFLMDIGQKLRRLVSLIGYGNEPNNESVADTCMDAANYFALWAAYIRKERG